MDARRIHVTEAEFTVLEPLWSEGPQTIRQLTGRIYPGQSTSDYATVQKLIERLEKKRCVKRDRSGHAHLFRASVAREDLIDQRLHEIADRLCDGSLVPLLNQLVRSTKLSAAEREDLHKLLRDAPKASPSGEKP